MKNTLKTIESVKQGEVITTDNKSVSVYKWIDTYNWEISLLFGKPSSKESKDKNLDELLQALNRLGDESWFDATVIFERSLKEMFENLNEMHPAVQFVEVEDGFLEELYARN